MRISDPSKVAKIVGKLKEDDAAQRASNRAAINNLFNGVSPYTEREAEENNIFTNVQPLIAPRIAHEARRQLAQSALRGERFFTVTIDTKDKEKRDIVSMVVTKRINRILRDSMRYYEVLRGADANVVLHGRGPSMWDDPFAWCPRLLSVEDLKVPSNTLIDFSNLQYFAVYQEATAAELMRYVTRKRVDPGWNVPAVKRLVAELASRDLGSDQAAGIEFPEKLAEDFKQNGLYYASDIIPSAKLWWFYQLTDDEDEPRWELCIIEDQVDKIEKSEPTFLYKQKSHFATSIDQILHVQYADGGNVAPFKYHSVRGLGYLLYPVLNMTNRLFCRFMDSIFEACNQLFRNVGEEDREKLAYVMLANMSVLPRGVEYVPATERYTVNHNLVNAGLAMLRQFINENSASFVAEPDTGTAKAMTATQVMAQVQQAGVLLNSMVQMQAVYRTQQYREICRRFALPGSTDQDVRSFQEEMRKQGVWDEISDFERWTVVPERAIGGGNKMLELSQTAELVKAIALYPPESQRIILRDFTLAQTDDPDKTAMLVPDEPKPPSDTDVFASLAFGSLCQAVPVMVPKGINHLQYAQSLTVLLAARVRQLAQTGSVPAPETLLGLSNVIQHIMTVLNQIAGDETKKSVITQIMQALQQVGQTIAAMSQQQGPQMSPEDQAKVQAILAQAQAKAQAQQMAAQQRMQQRQQAHEQKLAAEQLKTQAEIEAKDYLTAAQIEQQRRLAAAKPPQPTQQQ